MLTPTEILEAYLKNDRRNLRDICRNNHYVYDAQAAGSLAIDLVIHWRTAVELGDNSLMELANDNMKVFREFQQRWGYV